MKEPFYKNAVETVVLHNFMSSMETGCDRCTLACSDHKPIVYRGNPESSILLVGEAPGKVEQEERSPFVGPAGQLMDNMMSSIGLSTEEDMCITNAVYCRPTAPKGSGKQNYTPKEDQVILCAPFTKSFVRIIKPKVIIACGRTALQQLSGEDKVRLGEWEGKWTSYKYSLPYSSPCRGSKIEEIPMFVMTHPAAILHLGDGTEAQRQKKLQVWKYLQEFRDSWKEKANDGLSI